MTNENVMSLLKTDLPWIRTGVIVISIFLAGWYTANFLSGQFAAVNLRLSALEERVANLPFSALSAEVRELRGQVQENRSAIAVQRSQIDWLTRQQEARTNNE